MEVVGLEPPKLEEVKGLTRDDVSRQLLNRKITPSGILSENIKKLSQEFQSEYDQALAEYHEKRRSAQVSLLKDEQEIKEAMLYTRYKTEEEQVLKENSRLKTFVGLAKRNETDTTFAIQATPTVARMLYRCLVGCSSVYSLDLSNGSISDEVGRKFVQVLSQANGAPNLRRLELDSNNIGVLTVKALAQKLAKNITLEYLSLENNDLTMNENDGSAVNALSKALERNKSLLGLNLSRTCLTAGNASALAGMMAVNRQIIDLDMSRNQSVPISSLQAVSSQIARNLEEHDRICQLEKQEARAKYKQESEERSKEEKEENEQSKQVAIAYRSAKRQEERISKDKEQREQWKKELEGARQLAYERQALFEQTLGKGKKGGKKK